VTAQSKQAMATALDLLLPSNPAQSARTAGLRHVDPNAVAGLARVRGRSGFVYTHADGRRVRDRATLERIRQLVIPPAWNAVWICPAADGHIQAIGRDARGRRQYRYHSRWREVRDATKYDKMLAFARALPRIRAVCERDLALPGLPRAKVLATVVRLLDLTHIRVGNEEYVRDNGSYGLTTLRDWHVRVDGSEVRFRFRAKGGKASEVGVRDRRLARIVAQCGELPGHELFQYVDEEGTARIIDSSDVNAYIHTTAGQEFTAKDFRTWAGTVLAASTLRAMRSPLPREGAAKTRALGRLNKNIASGIKAVAAHLGNTPAVCRRCYVHPAVLHAYLDGSLRLVRARGDEGVVRALLARATRATSQLGLTKALHASLRVVTGDRVRRRLRASR
jgi:DNA topoisomerase-1